MYKLKEYDCKNCGKRVQDWFFFQRSMIGGPDCKVWSGIRNMDESEHKCAGSLSYLQGPLSCGSDPAAGGRSPVAK